jgi:arylsulfatase A-like enzyme
MGRRYYANVKDFKSEEDFFPAKVMEGAASWLEENARQKPFFLQVESFDVHEPFHVPEPYASMYDDGKGGERFTLWPPYQDTEQLARSPGPRSAPLWHLRAGSVSPTVSGPSSSRPRGGHHCTITPRWCSSP